MNLFWQGRTPFQAALYMAVGFFLLFLMPSNALADHYYLFPASNFSVANGLNANATSNWSAVSKGSQEDPDYSDSYYSCIRQNNASTFTADYYNMTEFTPTVDSIQSVTIYVNLWTYTSGNGTGKGCIKLGNTYHETGNFTATKTQSWFSGSWTTDPRDNSEWTPTKIEEIQGGILLKPISGGWIYSNAMYIDVEYTPGEEEGGEEGGGTTPPTGTIYTVPVFVNDWTGEYTTDFETYKANSQIRLFGENGPLIFITKKEFTVLTGLFGALMGAVLMWALFKAVL